MKYTGERIVPRLPECGPGTFVYETHLARYRFAAAHLTGQRILDIACGVGYGTEFLSSRANRQVLGGDISKEAIRYAAVHHTGKNLSYTVMSADQLPLPSSAMDCVVSFETIEHLPDGERFLNELTRVLRDNGRIIISTPNRATYGLGLTTPDNPFHTREYSLDEFKDLLSSRFREVSLFSQRRRKRKSRDRLRTANALRNVRRADRIGLRRLIPQRLRTFIREVSDPYDRDPNISPMAPGDDPLYFVAVAEGKRK